MKKDLKDKAAESVSLEDLKMHQTAMKVYTNDIEILTRNGVKNISDLTRELHKAFIKVNGFK